MLLLYLQSNGDRDRTVPISDKSTTLIALGGELGREGCALQVGGRKREPGELRSSVGPFNIIARGCGRQMGKPDLTAHDM